MVLIKVETVPQKGEGTHKVTKQLGQGYELREAHLPIPESSCSQFLAGVKFHPRSKDGAWF